MAAEEACPHTPQAVTAGPGRPGPHSLGEDIWALGLGVVMISFAAAMLKSAGALSGGIVGLAFLLHYATGVSFGLLFFCLNLPFYWLAYRRMGVGFVLRTFCVVSLVALLAGQHGRFIDLAGVNPIYAGLFANALMGLGFIVIFRHRASMGGVNILALHLQERLGIPAGKVMLAIDATILLCSLPVVRPAIWLASIGGAVLLNLNVWLNHKPGRYFG